MRTIPSRRSRRRRRLVQPPRRLARVLRVGRPTSTVRRSPRSRARARLAERAERHAGLRGRPKEEPPWRRRRRGIVIFRHIQKTAGTSVRNLFENLRIKKAVERPRVLEPVLEGQAPGVAIERMRLVRSMRERLAAGEKSLAPPMAPVWRRGRRTCAQLHLLHHPDSTFCGGMRGLERELHGGAAARCAAAARRYDGARAVVLPPLVVRLHGARGDRCLFPAYVELNSERAVAPRPRLPPARAATPSCAAATYSATRRSPRPSSTSKLRAVDLVAPMEQDRRVFAAALRFGGAARVPARRPPQPRHLLLGSQRV